MPPWQAVEFISPASAPARRIPGFPDAGDRGLGYSGLVPVTLVWFRRDLRLADQPDGGRRHPPRLSPYTRFGVISPRRIHAAVTAAARDRERAASAAFIRELAWRRDASGLRAWREGRTGYPIVDAGMRELAETGFMHNRARLVAASFLTKHLLIDWRHGTRWFMRQLLQGRRFDPDGTYVRRWLPELAAVPAPAIHAPWEAGGVAGYPAPIVEHQAARGRALRALGAATRGSGASAPSGAARGRPGRRGTRPRSGGRDGGRA